MLKFVILGVATLAFVGTAVAADLPHPQPVVSTAPVGKPVRLPRCDASWTNTQKACSSSGRVGTSPGIGWRQAICPRRKKRQNGT